MRTYAWAIVLLAALHGAEAKAAAGTTGATIDSIQVVQNGKVQRWTITMKGTVSLGAQDKWGTQKFTFIDPNKNALAVTLSFIPPTPGNTTSYTATLTTTTKGNWTGEVSLGYTDAQGTQSNFGLGKAFTVP